jgi:hypothetical protein
MPPNRKNALFAGSDQGRVDWGVIASLIETCKLNAVDPQAYLASTLTRRINRHPASQIDQLKCPEHSAYASVSLKRRASTPIDDTARRQRSHGAGKQDRRQLDAETQLTDFLICSLD